MIEKRKGIAYVTRGRELLVFIHPFSPEAGIQVPAGTIEPDESPERGTLREAREETGLKHLRLGAYLGYQRRDMSDFDRSEIHHRYFYHLICEEHAPERWVHGEFDLADRSKMRHVFEFYWADLPDGVPTIIADQGLMIDRLIAELS